MKKKKFLIPWRFCSWAHCAQGDFDVFVFIAAVLTIPLMSQYFPKYFKSLLLQVIIGKINVHGCLTVMQVMYMSSTI